MKRLIIINLVLILLFLIIPSMPKEEIVEIIENAKQEIVEEKPIETTSRAETTPRTINDKNIILTVDSDLRILSNLSAEDYNKMLKGTGLSGLGNTLVNIEKTYGINGLYIMGLACEESAYGNSNIAKTKNNITGYCVYDSNTKAGKKFSSYSECLNTTSKWLKNKYLTENATYFSGYTPKDIDKHYCTDKTHAQKIINIVNKLILKL